MLGVVSSHHGRGIGRALLEALEREARGLGVHRLELTVMIHNQRARRLYERAGFLIEGIRRDALLVGTEYVSEYWMSKIISPQPETNRAHGS